MRKFRLSIEEKARLMYESTLDALAVYQRLTPEEALKKLMEEDNMTKKQIFDHYIGIVSKADTVIANLKKGGNYKEMEEIPILHLKVKPTARAIESVTTNLGERMTLRLALARLETSFSIQPLYRNVRAPSFGTTQRDKVNYLKEKMKYLLKTGFDKPLDGHLWMSDFSSKVFEYEPEIWPKLITVYDKEHFEFAGGNEGHEWRCLTSPRRALECMVWIDSDKKAVKR